MRENNNTSKPKTIAGKRKALRDARLAQKERPARVRAPYIRVLPITMMMAVLLLGVKIKDVYVGTHELRLRYDAAYAAEEAKEDASKDEEVKDEDGEEEKAEGASDEEGEGDEENAAAALSPEAEEDLKNKILEEKFKLARQHQYSNIELDMLQTLSQRREELEKREREIDMKEKLLEATELRINDKLTEMKSMEEELTDLLKSYDEKQDIEIVGLVKIYESMKPKDAAEIFNDLDMPILLQVIDRMSERKVAPVLAGMEPAKAREVTEELAVMRRLRSEKRAMIAQ